MHWHLNNLWRNTNYNAIFLVLVLLIWKWNETAGCHRHILRLPIFVKTTFKKIESFFSQKNSFFIIFSNFSNYQNFLIFCQKNLMIRAHKTLYGIKPLDTHSTVNLPPSSILEKTQVVFQKTHLLFQKKTIFWTLSEFLLFQSHSAANLL